MRNGSRSTQAARGDASAANEPATTDSIRTAAPGAERPGALPLWPLPLLAGLVPALGVLLVLRLFTGPGGASCNAFVDDCGSISRMARHGLANQLFRSFVIPGAVLQMLTWLAAARALAAAGLAQRDAFAVALVGLCAGVALVAYGSVLGSEGDLYLWLRRWGTLAYFGGTYLAMLLFARAAQRLHAAHRLALPRGHGRMMLGLLAFIAAACLGHVFASAGPFPEWEDRIENLTEWWGALALTLAFVTMAALWRRWGLGITIGLPRAD